MDNPRPAKVAVVEEVRQRFDDADAAILTEYRGLKVKDLAGLRRTLRSSGGDYKIYKNTLVRLAAQGSGLALEEMLVGPTGIAFVDGDAAAVAKVLRDYARTNPLLVIKGGVLGDKVIGAAETSALADLPSREVLLARVAGALAAPLQQLAGLLQALPRNLAYGLAALRDLRAEAEPAGEVAVEPVSEALVADAPADEAQVSEAPAVEAPVEPSTDAEPTAEVPVAEAPAAEAPTDEPQVEPSTDAEPTDEAPVAEAAAEPDAEVPGAEAPADSTPSAEQPQE